MGTGIPTASAFDVQAASRLITTAQNELATNPRSFEARIGLGFGYLAMDALEEAEEAFRVAATQEPNQPSGHYWLGRTEYRRRRYTAALDAFARVASLLPRWGEVHAEMGRCYFRLHRASEADRAFRTALAYMALDEGHPPEIIPPPSFGDDDHEWVEKVAPMSPIEVRYFLSLNLLEQGKIEDAARECERALSVRRDAELLVLAGMIASRRGQLAEAERLLLEATQAKPTYAPAYYQLGTVYSKMRRPAEAAEVLARWKELDDAEKRLQEERAALERNPDKVPRFISLGSLYLNSGATNDAIAAYQKAIWFDPNAVDAYNGLAHAYALEGNLSAALTAAHKALELDPNRAEAHAGLGFVRLRQALASQQEGDYAAALASYREAVRLKPDFLEAWSRIGEIAAKQARYAEAQTAYEKALSLIEKVEMEPAARQRLSARTHQSLGDVLLLQAQYDAAKSHYEQAAREDETLVESRYNLGFLEYRQGNLDKAETYYRSVIALNPNMPEAHHILGLLYVDAERFADAEREFREALKLRNDSAPTLERLAHLLGHKEERLDEALELAQRATELRPQSASYWNTLSWIRYRRGEYEEAEHAIRQALALDPNNALYQEGLRVLEGLRARKPSDAGSLPQR